jgi:hypothetical protein
MKLFFFLSPLTKDELGMKLKKAVYHSSNTSGPSLSGRSVLGAWAAHPVKRMAVGVHGHRGAALQGAQPPGLGREGALSAAVTL